MAFKDLMKKFAKIKDKGKPKVDEKLVGQKPPKLDSKSKNSMIDKAMKGKS